MPHACALAPWRTVLLVDKVGALAGEAELRFETKGLWRKYTPPAGDVWTKNFPCQKNHINIGMINTILLLDPREAS